MLWTTLSMAIRLRWASIRRRISVSASAMSFDYGAYRFNLVDTPGHSDFSEDTYRTLTAVDAGLETVEVAAEAVEAARRGLRRVLPVLLVIGAVGLVVGVAVAVRSRRGNRLEPAPPGPATGRQSTGPAPRPASAPDRGWDRPDADRDGAGPRRRR